MTGETKNGILIQTAGYGGWMRWVYVFRRLCRRDILTGQKLADLAHIRSGIGCQVPMVGQMLCTGIAMNVCLPFVVMKRRKEYHRHKNR
ncbi:MAG: hypothetical protein K6F98_01715 [Bacteroidales bacterium]|nr:hypothetical protein [Bacteroidales bacterium]